VGANAPTTDVDAPTRNLQNIKDKHADQKWACRQYYDADARQKGTDAIGKERDKRTIDM
jgi:hypothetical protein